MNFCIYMVRSRNTCNIKSHSMHRNMHMHQTMGWNSLWQLTLLFVCLLPTRVWMPAWTSFLYSSGITESCAWFHRKRNRSRNTNMYWNTEWSMYKNVMKGFVNSVPTGDSETTPLWWSLPKPHSNEVSDIWSKSKHSRPIFRLIQKLPSLLYSMMTGWFLINASNVSSACSGPSRMHIVAQKIITRHRRCWIHSTTGLSASSTLLRRWMLTNVTRCLVAQCFDEFWTYLEETLWKWSLLQWGRCSTSGRQ